MPEAIRSPLADYHLAQGATLVEYHGGVVPARFTDPRAEHRAVREAAGLFDFSFRAKFAVAGADRVRFLQGMVSNDVKNLAPGGGADATILNVQGHILADLRIYCDQDRFVIDADADLRDKAMQTLRRYIIADKVGLEPQSLTRWGSRGHAPGPSSKRRCTSICPKWRSSGTFGPTTQDFPFEWFASRAPAKTATKCGWLTKP